MNKDLKWFPFSEPNKGGYVEMQVASDFRDLSLRRSWGWTGMSEETKELYSTVKTRWTRSIISCVVG